MGGYHPRLRRSSLIFYCLARAAAKNRFSELSLRPLRSPVTALRYLEQRHRAAARYNVPLTTVSLVGIWHLSAVAGVCDDL